MKKILILILTGLVLSSCASYKLVYLYNDKGDITEEFLAKRTKTKELKTYELIDENGNKSVVATIDISNKEKNQIKKRLK